MVDSIVLNSPTWLLAFVRIGGLLGMNPLFARRNVPAMVRAGLTFLITALVVPGIAVPGAAQMDSLGLAMRMLRELFVGLACGFVFQI